MLLHRHSSLNYPKATQIWTVTKMKGSNCVIVPAVTEVLKSLVCDVVMQYFTRRCPCLLRKPEHRWEATYGNLLAFQGDGALSPLYGLFDCS